MYLSYLVISFLISEKKKKINLDFLASLVCSKVQTDVN